ncbi:transcriptional regulator with XRE-family HTH domain [Pedobacter africanus]|uniref:Transcriptional regulator with XRE-family HTH domain n=1 Tax=Pedobacter africanus TaxID=151894 RepID=A0ACC6KT35_9SPHI|nr:hypothetical protein [Pedobacter africanus]MDR6782391.1 transcriptional regulator with XRE-family HTH domain [Pedobacter africanus]
MDLNVGRLIEHIVREDHVRISELSRKLRVSRRTIYNWFNKKTLKHEIIDKIGKAIKHDFSKEFPDDFELVGPEIFTDTEPFIDVNVETDDAGGNSVSYWMIKYINLLEKYNELLRQTNNF